MVDCSITRGDSKTNLVVEGNGEVVEIDDMLSEGVTCSEISELLLLSLASSFGFNFIFLVIFVVEFVVELVASVLDAIVLVLLLFPLLELDFRLFLPMRSANRNKTQQKQIIKHRPIVSNIDEYDGNNIGCACISLSSILLNICDKVSINTRCTNTSYHLIWLSFLFEVN